MKNCKWWFITVYSFDEDRPLYGPYSSEKECWNAMLENAKTVGNVNSRLFQNVEELH